MPTTTIGDHTGQPIEIEAIGEPSGIVIRVRDCGAPFDPSPPALPEEDVADRSSLSEGGRGVFLMHSTMDEVHYTREGDRNVLTLVKRIVPATLPTQR